MATQKLTEVQKLPEVQNSPLPEKNEEMTVSAGLANDTDITKRRVINDYSSYKPISIEPGKEQIRLLQILPPENDNDEDEVVCVLFDVPASGNERIVYIALSYCWGDMTRQRTIGLVHHRVDEGKKKIVAKKDHVLPGQETLVTVDTETRRTFNVTESLYQALKSLRKAAPRLKENFQILDHQPIWIDALCINQSDMKERNSQVGMMGSIYSQAFFVFIWLGEDQDIMRGLNLIQAMINLLRDTWESDFDMLDPKDEHIMSLFNSKYKIDNEILDPESCFQTLERLFANPYFRRIWVLQEATINIQCTWIHVTNAEVPWVWIIVADRFRTLWRELYYTAHSGELPVIWAALLKARLNYHGAPGGEETHENTETVIVGAPLYSLFINTYEEFEASDLRDKLYALLDLGIETRSGTQGKKELAPDYERSVSEVFSKFTLWCIRRTGNLGVLSLLAGGPRRLMPEDASKFADIDGRFPESSIDARSHPSWAVWPTAGGSWTTSSLLKAENRGGFTFDLASDQELCFFDLTTHPMIKLPEQLARHFLTLGGKRIGVVKSVNRMPLRCFAFDGEDENFIGKARWATEEMQKDMEKHTKTYKLGLTHPYEAGQSLLEGGLAPLWYIIRKEVVEGTMIGEDLVETASQEWLGRKGSRYEGKDELMFRDFLETLLLSPVYRGKDSLSWDGEGVPDGPWSDPTVATSFAMFWAQNDPRFSYFPPKIGEFLTSEMFARSISRNSLFPFLFLGHGKCFFITEDERMGLCPVETRPGDIIVALFGSQVPFVVRPVKNEGRFDEDNDWSFEGHELLKDGLFRFIGECYVHERMSKEFLAEYDQELGDMEAFNLC